MKIIAKCPFCGKNIEIPEEKSNKKARCPYCGGMFKVPKFDSALSSIDGYNKNVVVDEEGNIYG